MKSFFFALTQLTFVALVYAFAYRAGYRDAQSKAMSVVNKFAHPITDLLDKLNATVEQVTKDHDNGEDEERG